MSAVSRHTLKYLKQAVSGMARYFWTFHRRGIRLMPLQTRPRIRILPSLNCCFVAWCVKDKTRYLPQNAHSAFFGQSLCVQACILSITIQF